MQRLQTGLVAAATMGCLSRYPKRDLSHQVAQELGSWLDAGYQ
jgi:hypothetical protein